uniref:Glycosyltransferase 2-like domain-containing protein n=1 Tax=viral metagenome TaxID=1070528 RepID=A0A6C0JTB8_9ZZZZ
MTKKVAVVTPCITNEHLTQCFESVQKQSYNNVTHYVIVDGITHWNSVQDIVDNVGVHKTISPIYLSENIGKDFYGHRAFAASSFLVNADIITYLDADNWYESNHVESIVNKISEGYDWTYSLRNIHSKDGKFLCEDNCESLGKWPIYGADSNQMYHIDTSCFGVTLNVALSIGHAWYGKWGADRQFFSALQHFYPKWDCTGEYSMNYRLAGNDNSVNLEFFEKGNDIVGLKYANNFPWQSKNLTTNTEIK